jgi:hypothetical protein
MPKPKRLFLNLETSLIPRLRIRNHLARSGIINSILSGFHDSMAPFSIGIAL